MAEVGIVDNPTTLGEQAHTSGDPNKSLTFEIKTVMPLEGTTGAVMHRLNEVISQTQSERSQVVDMDQWAETVERQVDYELEQRLVHQIVAQALGKEGYVEGENEVSRLNRVSAAEATRALDTQIIEGEEGLKSLAAKDPKGIVAGKSWITNERMFKVAQSLRQRFGVMPQAPRTPQNAFVRYKRS